MLDGIAALVKALLYGALLSAAGAPLAAASLRSYADVADSAARIMRRAAIATLVLSVTAALLLFVRLGGQFDQPTLGAVFSSGAGAALALQLAGAALLLVPVTDDASGRAWPLSAALIMTASVAFNGHSAAMSPAAGLLAMAHVTAAAWWVGSLWLLRRACTETEFGNLARTVTRFSKLASVIVAALAIAGIVLIVALVDFASSPWLTDYVLALGAKLALVALLLGLAIYNKFRLTPRLTHDRQAAAALHRTITAELAVIGGILIVTATLTTYFSPES